MVEVPANALQFLLHIAPQRCGDLDVMACDAELHTSSPCVTSVYICPGPVRRRSFEAAIPMASRYLAMFGGLHGLPSAESSSAMRPSLNGASGSSSQTSFLI